MQFIAYGDLDVLGIFTDLKLSFLALTETMGAPNSYMAEKNNI